MWPVDEERSALPYEYFRDEAQRVLEEYLNLSKQGKTPTVYKMRGTAFEDGVLGPTITVDPTTAASLP